ncbi:MAG: glutamate 5-kinase [Phycisphaerales bacterium]
MSDGTRPQIESVKQLVIKIGSAVIAPGGKLDVGAVARLAGQVAAARKAGVRVTVVSSGAIASGFRVLGLDGPPESIVQKQAAAAVGQPRLMAAWGEALGAHGLAAAQVLLTADDVRDRARYLNARHTLGELLVRGVVPVINENDTVAFDEIRFGDNDMLSAHAASLIDAGLLLILSSAQGLYEGGDPGKVVPLVEVDEADARAAARSSVREEKTATGVGGMASKLTAVQIAAAWGVPTVIAGGNVERVVERVLSGETLGTLFVSRGGGANLRKRWLSAGVKAAGRVVVDDGARRALVERGASLLPKGVVRVEGEFERGEPVEVCGADGVVVARGLAAYSGAEARLIAGKRSDEIAGMLGYSVGEELMHRDDLVVVRG